MRQAKGYASEAYKSQARADVAETVGDVFRAGSKGVGLVNRNCSYCGRRDNEVFLGRSERDSKLIPSGIFSSGLEKI